MLIYGAGKEYLNFRKTRKKTTFHVGDVAFSADHTVKTNENEKKKKKPQKKQINKD